MTDANLGLHARLTASLHSVSLFVHVDTCGPLGSPAQCLIMRLSDMCLVLGSDAYSHSGSNLCAHVLQGAAALPAAAWACPQLIRH